MAEQQEPLVVAVEGPARPYSKVKLSFILVTLSVSMAAMGSSIVMESSTFPRNQWLLILLYTTAFDMLFLLTLKLKYRLSWRRIWLELRQWRQYMMIGMLWSMNYVFILLSAPYLSNTIQVVLAQFQSILIALIDWKYIGIILSKRKWLCIITTIFLGIASLFFNAEKTKNRITITVFWSLVYLLNAFAGGLASLSTEALLKVKREAARRDSNNTAPFIPGMEVTILNFCSNFYGIFFCCLGLPLALYSGRAPPTGDPEGSPFELIDVKIFADVRILYWVLMVFSSFVYTLMSGLVAIDQSAIFNAMCSSFGSCIQLCFFLLPMLPDQFRAKFDVVTFVLAVSLTIVAGIYIATSDELDMKALMQSAFGRYYSDAINHNSQGWALPAAGMFVYFLTWAGLAGLWFGYHGHHP